MSDPVEDLKKLPPGTVIWRNYDYRIPDGVIAVVRKDHIEWILEDYVLKEVEQRIRDGRIKLCDAYVILEDGTKQVVPGTTSLCGVPSNRETWTTQMSASTAEK